MIGISFFFGSVNMGRPAPNRSDAGCAVSRLKLRRRARCERSWHMSKIRFLGLDVHPGSIAVALAESNVEVRSRLLRGWAYRVCSVLAIDCARCSVGGHCPDAGAGQSWRSCQDGRRNAEKLARCYRAGDLHRFGFPHRRTKRFVAWSELARARERITIEPVSGGQVFSPAWRR